MTSHEDDFSLLEIGAVAQQTGLTPATIRAWENRYGAVTPVRSHTRRRLYTGADARRLVLLRELVDGGHRIGQIARLQRGKLEELLAQRVTRAPIGEATPGIPAAAPHPPDSALAAVVALDGAALQRALDDALLALGRVGFLDDFLVPLMHAVGELYTAGRIRAVHEHLATATVRAYTEGMEASVASGEHDPQLVVTTPQGQLHELGALLVAVTARSEGWRSTYLGPNLPAEEIALAVRDTGARHLALGLSFPADDPRLVPELKRLLRLLSSDATVYLGGPTSGEYAAALTDTRVRHILTLTQFRAALAQVRRPEMTRRERA
jgi:DNA-binding transcriptional MerR regulator/methylmalonyl-CoA mutase cobalamin-binding subunit